MPDDDPGSPDTIALMRISRSSALLATAMLVTSCGSDSGGDESPSTTATSQTSVDRADTTAPDSDFTEVEGPIESADAEPSDDTAASGPGVPETAGDGTATLSLANGETYDFAVLCALEPQIAAGSEILFTATSYDDPSLDITQFGDEGPVTSVGSVTVVDAESFEALWGASTSYEPFGGSLELTLDGSTIRGSGDFYPGDDPVEGGEPVEGDVVAEC